MSKYTTDDGREVSPVKSGILIFVLVFFFIVFCVGGVAGCRSFNRYQKRADANNNVKVTSINIRRAEQQARVVKAQNATIQAQADQRTIAAIGIRHAQDHIAATLTPLYVQWEAIQAQLALAKSQNSTFVYLPVGSNGVPLVNDVSKTGPQQVGGGK